jgi:hypothetical protein
MLASPNRLRFLHRSTAALPADETGSGNCTARLDLLGEELSLDAQPIDYGHDLTMIRNNLQHSPQERIERQASASPAASTVRPTEPSTSTSSTRATARTSTGLQRC